MELAYKPPGPVAAAFMQDRSRVSMIKGPVGSGKTVACIWKMVTIAMEQAPSKIDGKRYTRWLIIRDTYENTSKTVMLSWLDWFPKTVGTWIAGPPAEHIMQIRHPVDGTVVHMHVVLAGLGEHSVENLLRGKEMTGAYVNEADLTPEDLIIQLQRRAGRYPRASHAKASWRGVVCDMNAPDVENWAYRRFEEKRYPSHAIFHQPSGRSPQAENLENLPDRYYEDQIEEAAADPDNTDLEWWVKRYVDSEYVYARTGKPVFRHFSDKLHVAQVIPRVNPMLPGLVGSDAGRTPHALIAQKPDANTFVILDEVYVDGGDAADLAGELNDRIERDYPDLKGWQGWGDPAASKPTETSNDSWLKIVSRLTAFRHRAAPGENNLTLRIGAVNKCLKGFSNGHPRLIISPKCRRLRRAFNSGYQYKKYHVAGRAQFRDKPDKNEYSHVMDACMNLILGAGGFFEVMERPNRGPERKGDLRSRVKMGQEKIG